MGVESWVIGWLSSGDLIRAGEGRDVSELFSGELKIGALGDNDHDGHGEGELGGPDDGGGVVLSKDVVSLEDSQIEMMAIGWIRQMWCRVVFRHLWCMFFF